MRHLPVIALTLCLAGCSTVDVGLNTPPAGRALDPLNDDLTALTVAFDLPRGIGLVDKAQTLDLDIAAPLNRHIKAALTEADADDLPAGLPPPGQGRAYYLLNVSDKDKASLRAAQSAARSARPSATATITAAARYCTSASVDPKQVTITVRVALPGAPSLVPLVDRQLLADALAGSPLPACS